MDFLLNHTGPDTDHKRLGEAYSVALDAVSGCGWMLGLQTPLNKRLPLYHVTMTRHHQDGSILAISGADHDDAAIAVMLTVADAVQFERMYQMGIQDHGEKE